MYYGIMTFESLEQDCVEPMSATSFPKRKRRRSAAKSPMV